MLSNNKEKAILDKFFDIATTSYDTNLSKAIYKAIIDRDFIKLKELHEYIKKNHAILLYFPHKKQKEFHLNGSYERWLLWANRTGKTVSCAVETIAILLFENPEALYLKNEKLRIRQKPLEAWASALTFEISVRIQQAEINKWLPRALTKFGKFTQKNGFSGRLVQFTNGSSIFFKYDAQGADRYQGEEINVLWLDEEHTEAVFNEASMRPKNGRVIGSATLLKGFTWLYDRAVKNQTEYIWYSCAGQKDNPHYPREQIIRNKALFSKKEYQIRVLGRHLNLAEGLAYYAFDRDIHCRVLNMKDAPGYIGLDFNVNPMAAVLMRITEDRAYAEAEITLRNTNTWAMSEEILKTWGKDYPICPDPTGNARNTVARGDINSNHKILKKHGFKLIIPKMADIMHENKLNVTNYMLMNAENQAHYWVNPKCKELIQDYEEIGRTDDGHIDKSNPKRTHHADAADNPLVVKFPIKYSSMTKPFYAHGMT